MYLTYRYRIKDSSHLNFLKDKANKANFIWNYYNEISKKYWRESRKWVTEKELNQLTTGSSQDLDLNAQVIQAILKEFCKKRKQHKKLSWRSSKRKLGWIPFTNQNIRHIKNGSFQFMGRKFKFWKHRKLQGKIKSGSFNQNSLGYWFVNFVCELPNVPQVKGTKKVGIDLGLKSQITTSDGVSYQQTITKDYAVKLAKAQRAQKKKQVRKIHTRIKNKRKDWNHQITTEIVKNYDQVYVGDVKSNKIKSLKNLAKSVYNASWYQIKTFFSHKAKKLGKVFQEVSESHSTVTCSVCLSRTGPSGLGTLGVRAWNCSNCNAEHHRDVNAAQNILQFALGRESRLAETRQERVGGTIRKRFQTEIIESKIGDYNAVED